MKTPASILEVSGLRVTRDRTTILHDLDWRVRHGEHWAILGPNGCGKTSLLKALTGFLPPSAGEFAVLGQHYGASDWRELRRHLGIVSSAIHASIPLEETALETVVSGRYAQLDLWAPVTRADAPPRADSCARSAPPISQAAPGNSSPRASASAS